MHFRKHQPAIIPASHAGRISGNLPLRIVQAFGAEGVIPRQAAQLGEEVVRGYVVRPGCRHGFRDVAVVEVGELLFDAAQFCQGIDLVGAEGVD